MTTITQIIIDNFINNIDITKEYSLVELKKIITTEHKKAYSDNKKLGAKKLTDYQKYVKENLSKTKSENPELKQNDVMKLVAKKWNEYKKNKETSDILEEDIVPPLENKKDKKTTDILEEDIPLPVENKKDLILPVEITQKLPKRRNKSTNNKV
tara:strand:+ start:681 stop:1142 length:462 start_codon:yes stop_codon:yes gene_type:complete